jgi:hypothetical protein
MIILEHIKQLSANLLPQDEQALTEALWLKPSRVIIALNHCSR